MDKYQHYEDASGGLLAGLQACEAKASKHLLEPIALDPKNLQRQLEETKVKKEEGGGGERHASAILAEEFPSAHVRAHVRVFAQKTCVESSVLPEGSKRD